MIVQACLNGSRSAGYHPNVPILLDDLIRSAIDSVWAGAAELHLHVHGDDGRESLQPGAVTKTVRAIRESLPGTLFGVSSGEWIEGDHRRTLRCISAWEEVPDYASVNMNETGAVEVIEALLAKGVGIEAGIATVGEANDLVESGLIKRVFRVLVEMDRPDLSNSRAEAEQILKVLRGAPNRKSILLHGMDETVWPFVQMAADSRLSTRIGLEDALLLPNGTIAQSNAELVAEAVNMMRKQTAGS